MKLKPSENRTILEYVHYDYIPQYRRERDVPETEVEILKDCKDEKGI